MSVSQELIKILKEERSNEVNEFLSFIRSINSVRFLSKETVDDVKERIMGGDGGFIILDFMSRLIAELKNTPSDNTLFETNFDEIKSIVNSYITSLIGVVGDNYKVFIDDEYVEDGSFTSYACKDESLIVLYYINIK